MRVMVCDDEPLARERAVRIVGEIEGYEVVAQAANGRQCLDILAQTPVDIVLLDIRMPVMDGMEAAYKMCDMPVPPAVIFCTAYEEHALEAFKVHAVDYLLKPIRKEDLSAALKSVKALNKAQIAEMQGGDDDAGRSHISAKTHRGLELIPIEDILYFMADQKYVTVFWREGEVLIDETLKELETEFDEHFIRIHRNALVSKARIEALEQESQGSYVVRLKGTDSKVTVSRRHVSGLRKVMQTL